MDNWRRYYGPRYYAWYILRISILSSEPSKRPFTPVVRQFAVPDMKRISFFACVSTLSLSAPGHSANRSLYFLKPGFFTNFTLSSPFQLPLSPVVPCHTTSAHLDIAPSHN
jgi:hypothetical protein